MAHWRIKFLSPEDKQKRLVLLLTMLFFMVLVAVLYLTRDPRASFPEGERPPVPPIPAADR